VATFCNVEIREIPFLSRSVGTPEVTVVLNLSEWQIANSLTDDEKWTTCLYSCLLGHMLPPLSSSKRRFLSYTYPSLTLTFLMGFNTLTFLSSANRKTSILWDVVGAHLSLQLCPNGSEAADDPRVECDAIHWIKPNSVPRDEGHYTFGRKCSVTRFDQFVCHYCQPEGRSAMWPDRAQRAFSGRAWHSPGSTSPLSRPVDR
jgi:hypothetical protein